LPLTDPLYAMSITIAADYSCKQDYNTQYRELWVLLNTQHRHPGRGPYPLPSYAHQQRGTAPTYHLALTCSAARTLTPLVPFCEPLCGAFALDPPFRAAFSGPFCITETVGLRSPLKNGRHAFLASKTSDVQWT